MKLNVDYLDDDQESAVLGAMSHLLEHRDLRLIWPAAHDHRKRGQEVDPDEVEIVIVPLDRIGAPAGASGATVFVAYYGEVHKDDFTLFSSPPLIIKLQLGEKLKQEREAADAWPSLDEKSEIRFAKPLDLFTKGEWNVLAAPFRAAFKRVPGKNRIQFNDVVDLWSKVVNKSQGSVAKGVEDAIKLITIAHQAGHGAGRPESMAYGVEYAWYLRNTLKSKGNQEEPYERISRLFSETDTVDGFGLQWPNPTRIVRLLVEEKSFSGVYGPVHGDLHPKNIVFDEEDRAHIIDFGWAKGEGHVVVDYVLLDINLRSMTLSPQVQEKEILDASRYLCPEDKYPKLTGEIDERMSIVKEQIWSLARANGVISPNGWHNEYLVPFFLVAYGLLVHLESARNQRALLATVLAAAQRIQEEGLL